MSPLQQSVKLVEHSKVSPPPGSVPSTSLPLTFFDLPWLLFPPNQPLFFFSFPHGTSHFTSTVLPNLKRSLSLTLHHFFPFAGNLLSPPPPALPSLLYSAGDSVSITVAEYFPAYDFRRLSADLPRPASDFHPLVPDLLVPDRAGNRPLLPILAVRFTVFPGSGVALGFSYRNVAADQRTFDRFLRFWSSISRSGFAPKDLAPTHDRCSMKCPDGLELTFLKQWWDLRHFLSRPIESATAMVRATFAVGRPEMEIIKRLVLSGQPHPSAPLFLSPYVLTCALLWVCLVKARGVDVGDSDPLSFGFVAGGIHRLDYPVPSSYMGNCVAFGRSTVCGGELTGENGLFFAARAIGEKVKELNGNVLGGAEEWVSTWNGLVGSDRHVVVLGSPKVGLYGLDFGLGRPEKIEDVGIDGSGAVSLAESRVMEGGIEIGLSLPTRSMDIFACLFTGRLQDS